MSRSGGPLLGLLVTCPHWLSGLMELATLEGIACREALALAADLSLTRIVIACDSKSIVKEINEGSSGIFASIIKEINARRNISSRCVIFEGRASNHEAHNLAKYSLSLNLGRHLCLSVSHDSICIPVTVTIEQ